MIAKVLSGLAVVLVLTGVYLVALETARTTPPSSGSRPDESDATGPQIALRGVEMIEFRAQGPAYRLASDEAFYSVLSGRLSARGVTLLLPERSGDVVMKAPEASWDMVDGQVAFPEGASAESDGAWTASVPEARVDLRNEVIAAATARLAGPGMTVEGTHLRWYWREGRVALDSPRSSVLPGKVLAPGGSG